MSCRLEEAHLAKAQLPLHPRALHSSAVMNPGSCHHTQQAFSLPRWWVTVLGRVAYVYGLYCSHWASRVTSGPQFPVSHRAPKGRFMWNMTLCSSLSFPTSLCGNSGLPMSSEAVMRNICLETLSRAEEKERKQDPSTRHGRYGGSLCL